MAGRAETIEEFQEKSKPKPKVRKSKAKAEPGKVSLANLGDLYYKMSGLKQKIDEAKALANVKTSSGDKSIKQLEAELMQFQRQFDAELKTTGEVAEFVEENDFDIARGAAKPRMTYQDGRFKILRSSTTTRHMDSKKFIDEYPLLAAEIAKIEIGKAEKALEKELGKQECAKAMNDLCSTTTRHSYEFYAPANLS